MLSIFSPALLLAIASISYSSAIPERLSKRAITGTKYLISFGDSYTETKFNIASTKPSAANPLGNPAFPGKTTSGAGNWISDLVRTYNTSLTLSYNFAYGGATVDANIVFQYSSAVKSVVQQTQEFSDNIASKPSYAPWTSENSLFAVWIGINDIGGTVGIHTDAQANATFQKDMTQLQAQLQIMYNAGGRNFLFLDVPPVQKSPTYLVKTASARQTEADGIATWNSMLASMVNNFTTKNANITAKIYDTSVPFNTVLADPTKYGAGANGATCYKSDGTTCLWWNDLHPGIAIQKQVAAGVAALYNGTFF